MPHQRIAKTIVILGELLYTALMRKKKSKDVAGPPTHHRMILVRDMREQCVGSTISPISWEIQNPKLANLAMYKTYAKTYPLRRTERYNTPLSVA